MGPLKQVAKEKTCGNQIKKGLNSHKSGGHPLVILTSTVSFKLIELMFE